MYKLFTLKPCEECKGTGDAHHQGHDYDCGDCLGTGYEEPVKRIMNLEQELNAVTEQRDKEREIYQKSYSAELARSNHYKQQWDRMAEALRDADECLEMANFSKYEYTRRMINEALQSLTTNDKSDGTDASQKNL